MIKFKKDEHTAFVVLFYVHSEGHISIHYDSQAYDLPGLRYWLAEEGDWAEVTASQRGHLRGASFWKKYILLLRMINFNTQHFGYYRLKVPTAVCSFFAMENLFL